MVYATKNSRENSWSGFHSIENSKTLTLTVNSNKRRLRYFDNWEALKNYWKLEINLFSSSCGRKRAKRTITNSQKYLRFFKHCFKYKFYSETGRNIGCGVRIGQTFPKSQRTKSGRKNLVTSESITAENPCIELRNEIVRYFLTTQKRMVQSAVCIITMIFGSNYFPNKACWLLSINFRIIMLDYIPTLRKSTRSFVSIV